MCNKWCPLSRWQIWALFGMSSKAFRKVSWDYSKISRSIFALTCSCLHKPFLSDIYKENIPEQWDLWSHLKSPYLETNPFENVSSKEQLWLWQYTRQRYHLVERSVTPGIIVPYKRMCHRKWMHERERLTNTQTTLTKGNIPRHMCLVH